jgi:flagellar biosynthesis chaperone FliJ
VACGFLASAQLAITNAPASTVADAVLMTMRSGWGVQAALSAIKSLSTAQEAQTRDSAARLEDKVSARQWRALRSEVDSLRAELKAAKHTVLELTQAVKGRG